MTRVAPPPAMALFSSACLVYVPEGGTTLTLAIQPVQIETTRVIYKVRHFDARINLRISGRFDTETCWEHVVLCGRLLVLVAKPLHCTIF